MPKLCDLLGLDLIKRRLAIRIAARRQDGRVLPHMLITGLPGCGKTTLGKAIAEEVDALFFRREARVFSDPAQLAHYLIKCVTEGRRQGRKSIIMLDEIHALKPKVQEALYYPMLEHCVDTEDGFVDLGEDFCILGATTDKAALTKPLISRFGDEIWDIGRYDDMLLSAIAAKFFVSEGFDFDVTATMGIAERCLGIPRRCEKLCGKTLDFVRARGGDCVTEDDVQAVIEMEGLDQLGLDPAQQRYLRVLKQGPCKIGVLACRVEQPDDLIKGEIEPILIALGLITVTGGGTRTLTEAGRLYGDPVKML